MGSKIKTFALLVLAICLLSACQKKTKYPAHKILILGNSVTYSPPNAGLEWKGSWGMAATSPDSDYVHLFTANLKKLNSNTSVRVRNIVDFENNFDTYDLSKNLKDELAYNPDLLIIRIGENVTREQDAALFDQRYKDLINYFKAKNPSLNVLAVGSVWPWRDFASNVMQKYSQFISLDFLHYDVSNYALGQFPNYAVQTHPSNKGMATVARYLAATVKPILYPGYIFTQE